jgi:hypothetical protein
MSSVSVFQDLNDNTPNNVKSINITDKKKRNGRKGTKTRFLTNSTSFSPMEVMAQNHLDDIGNESNEEPQSDLLSQSTLAASFNQIEEMSERYTSNPIFDESITEPEPKFSLLTTMPDPQVELPAESRVENEKKIIESKINMMSILSLPNITVVKEEIPAVIIEEPKPVPVPEQPKLIHEEPKPIPETIEQSKPDLSGFHINIVNKNKDEVINPVIVEEIAHEEQQNIFKNLFSSINNVTQNHEAPKHITTIEKVYETILELGNRIQTDRDLTNFNDYSGVISKVFAGENVGKYDVVELYYDNGGFCVRPVNSETTSNFYGIAVSNNFKGEVANILTSGITRAKFYSNINLPIIRRGPYGNIILKDNLGNPSLQNINLPINNGDVLVCAGTKNDFICGKNTPYSKFNSMYGKFIPYKTLLFNQVNYQYNLMDIEKFIPGIKFAYILDTNIVDDTILVKI